MAISNFGQLKAKVIAWSARGDLTDLVEDFILQAHEKIVRDMVLASEIELDEACVSLPSDCGEVVALYVAADAAVALRPATSLEMANGGSGLPQWYRVDSGEVVLCPAPDRSYAGRILFRPSRTFFANDAATNTVLTRYPFLYLHGAMAEFMRYDRDQAGEVSYSAQFQAGLEANAAAERKRSQTGMQFQTNSGVAV